MEFHFSNVETTAKHYIYIYTYIYLFIFLEHGVISTSHRFICLIRPRFQHISELLPSVSNGRAVTTLLTILVIAGQISHPMPPARYNHKVKHVYILHLKVQEQWKQCRECLQHNHDHSYPTYNRPHAETLSSRNETFQANAVPTSSHHAQGSKYQ